MGTQAVTLRVRGRDGFLVLHPRCHSQDAPTILNATSQPPCFWQGDGCDAIRLCLLLLNGLGPIAVGIRVRYLSDTDETLWFGRGVLISVVMEYVLSRIRTNARLEQYLPRLRPGKGDANNSYEARLQDVSHVRIIEHWGVGSILTVCPALLSCPCTLFTRPNSIIPETKGRSLEEMDIIFGAVSAEDRAENIARQEQGASRPTYTFLRTDVGRE